MAMERATAEEMLALMSAEIPHGIPEEVPLLEALGCELAEDLTTEIDQPPFPRSPLDGYAVRSADLAGASPEYPVCLTVIGEVAAGHTLDETVCTRPACVNTGEAVRIMTGAPIPDGADCVVKQEDTDYGETTVRIFTELSPWQNYCFRGEDFRCGARLAPFGALVDAVTAGTAAAMGRDRILVYRRPRVAVFATGDELSAPGAPLPPGKIYNSNLYLLSARLTELGVPPVLAEQVPDSEELMARKLRTAAEQTDFILTTGGVSVGKHDIMHEALRLMGARRLCWRLRLKPGMPTLSAVYEGIPGKKVLILALSGNPFGAAANLEVLARPVLARLWHRDDLLPQTVTAVLADEFNKASKVRRLLRASYLHGRVTIPTGNKSSGAIASMVGCNCLIDIPAGTPCLKPGDVVRVILC